MIYVLSGFVVVTVDFVESVYLISEDEGQVRICANATGQLERNIEVALTLQAISTSTDDIDPFDPAMFTFSEEMPSSCINVGIAEDSIFEDDETFIVELTGCDDIVRCGGGLSSSEVRILNDDCMS